MSGLWWQPMTAFLELAGVSFSWPRGSEVLKDIDLTLAQHSTVALMGSNGSGKTTLAKVIMGILQPSAGEVRLDGRIITDYPLAQRGRRIGYVFQNPERQLFAATVADEIGFALKYRGLAPGEAQDRVAEMLDFMELGQYAETFPFNLSHGEKQRLALAAVLALEPDFIILDEPSTGLDWARKRRLAAMLMRIGQRGVGYIVISHDYDFCQGICASALTLKGGRLA